LGAKCLYYYKHVHRRINMRKKKAENLKAVKAMITLPASFDNYLTTLGTSKFVQVKVAESILGMTLHQFTEHMGKLNDVRAHKDSLEKDFIRTARWISEGNILATFRTEKCIYLYVHWTLSDRLSELKISIDGNTFKHICYDTEIHNHDELISSHKEDVNDLSTLWEFNFNPDTLFNPDNLDKGNIQKYLMNKIITENPEDVPLPHSEWYGYDPKYVSAAYVYNKCLNLRSNTGCVNYLNPIESTTISNIKLHILDRWQYMTDFNNARLDTLGEME